MRRTDGVDAVPLDMDAATFAKEGFGRSGDTWAAAMIDSERVYESARRTVDGDQGIQREN